MRLLLLFIFSLMILSLTETAFAATYTWRTNSFPGSFDSAGAACEYSWSKQTNAGLSYAGIKKNGTGFNCMYNRNLGDADQVFDYAYSIGDSCQPGYVYNPDLGKCEPPPPDKCESTKGQEVVSESKLGDIEAGHMVRPSYPPGSLCSGSCLYSNPASVADAYRDANSVFQPYSYLGTGASCTADASTPEPTPPRDRSPSSSKSNECTNKVTDAEGRVHYSCLATDSAIEPGNLKCGTANGEVVCSVGKPSPSNVTTEKKTDVTETNNSDGSTTTNTTTTTTTTTCTGINSCTTTTTVNNGSSKTNADGSDGGSSSTCTGVGCKKPTDEDGKEDEKEDEDEDKDEVSGDECGQPLSCSGDVIQCAVLKQQKQSRCDWNYQDAKPGIESEIVKPEYQVGEDSHDMSGLFSSAIGAARWLPASCPAPERAGLHTRGAGSLQLSWQPTCDFASSMAPVFVAMASLFFALYVGRGIGGGA